MKTIVALVFSVFFVPALVADDLDILVRDISPRGVPYFHVVLDSSPTAFKVLCSYGPQGSCAPPFMTNTAYSNLRAGHESGDQITRYEVFSAILAGVFSRPEFESVNIALLVSDRDAGARVLSTYKRPGFNYGDISGVQALISAMASVSTEKTAGKNHQFQAKDAFYIWYRYINDTRQLVLDTEACPHFFSVVMATESSFEDGILMPELKRKLAIPTSTSEGFTQVLAKMHASSTDLVPRGLKGNNYIDKSWIVSPQKNADLARSWAHAGGTNRLLNIDDPILLEKSLIIAFSQAVSRSNTVIAPWAPVSSVGRGGRASRDIFIGMTEPRPTLRWPGNLKKYQMAANLTWSNPEAMRVVDKNSSPVLLSSGQDKGRIATRSLDLWTEVTSLPDTPVGKVVPGVDGRVVPRGGAGQQIPGYLVTQGMVIGESNVPGASRQVFVEPDTITNGSSNALLPFNADGGTTASRLAQRLGVSGVSEAEELIRWGRGLDVDDEDGDGIRSESRPWVMGSVLHSKATVLNYGAVAGYSAENPNIRVFIGTGDGIFHGLENTESSGSNSGREVFAFYPNESLADIKLYRENTISSAKMIYGVDGGISILSVDNNSDGNLNFRVPDLDEAYVYFGMRRGGYSYYALDVSDPAATPVLKWKVSRTGKGTTSNDFNELGLTFSRPIVGKVMYEEEPLDVVIFAGGYNGGWDESFEHRIGKDLSASLDVKADGSGSTGNAIYIVNARTGELVWKAIYGAVTDTASSSSNTRFRHAEMVHSIPSTVSAMTTAAGIIDRLYVGDTGGALWRVDLPVATGVVNPEHRKEHWFTSKLAELGGEGVGADRRFFHGPDIVRTKDSSGSPIDGILISSGDRAHPNKKTVANFHFYIKDSIVSSGDDGVRSRPPVTIGKGEARSALPDRTNCSTAEGASAGISCGLPTDKGWVIGMKGLGEKALSSPLVIGGKVYFTSYVPPDLGSCALSVGESFLYAVNLEDATPAYKGQRIHNLGFGSASAVIALGENLLMPLGGVGDLMAGECVGEVCLQPVQKLQKIYWREPGIDEI